MEKMETTIAYSSASFVPYAAVGGACASRSPAVMTLILRATRRRTQSKYVKSATIQLS